ncbi:MAG: extensin-like protein [Myxococcota bacterium]|nr:extensin-like protein [Myxococcota bacterium]
MKKAFQQNVSRAKPRLRIGAALSEAADTAAAALHEGTTEVFDEAPVELPAEPTAQLADQVRARLAATRQPRATASEALQLALGPQAAPAQAPVAQHPPVHHPVAQHPSPVALGFPGEEREVQQPAPPVTPELEEQDPDARRERLKERLKAVRENPRPEPLPPTVAEAGLLAVERITSLQNELSKVKALNQALAQDLEGARRTAERATEEARVRMDEARRLSTEMESRARLLTELERELSSLEGERDEALLALQESRQALHGADQEKAELQEEIQKRDAQIDESLAEEERLATELESSQTDASNLRRSVDALTSERDTLARQVSSLTAEVTELLEARRALQAVHRALSTAQVR